MTRIEKYILFGAPAIFLFGWFYYLRPEMHFRMCAVRHMLHVNCPGCGMIRAVSNLVHGNFRLSVFLNPMGIVFVVILIGLWLRTLCQALRGIGDLNTFLASSFFKIVFFAFIFGLFIQWFFYIGINLFFDGCCW